MVGWASDIPSYTLAQADGILRDLLRAQQPDGRPGRRLQDGRGRSRCSSATSAASRAARRSRRRVVTMEPKQLAEKRFRAEAETSPTVRVWWHARALRAQGPHARWTCCRTCSPDAPAGSTRASCWAGRSRTRPAASVDLKKYDGLRSSSRPWSRTARSPQAVEAAIDEEIARLAEGGRAGGRAAEGEEPGQGERLPPALVAASHHVPAPASTTGLGDWRYINTYADEVDAVTAADLQRVAAAAPDAREPHGRDLHPQGGAPPRPTRRSRRCRRRRRRIARQGLQQIEAETDAARLREGLAQLQQGIGRRAAGDEAGAGADAETRPRRGWPPSRAERSERHEDPRASPRRSLAAPRRVRARARPSRRTRTSSSSSPSPTSRRARPTIARC